MSKTVVGNYTNTTDALAQIRSLMNQGYPQDSISIIASQEDAAVLQGTGVTLESGFEYVDGANEETLWQRIKAFFSGEDARVHERSLAAYRDSIRDGNILVLVDDDLVPANLEDHLDTISDTYDTYAYDNSRMDTELKDDETLRLREEQMQIDKHNVKAGEAIIHKRVIEETKTVEVPVRHEEIVIERVPVSGAATDDANFEDETFTIPVMEEQVEVTKHPVITQEVKIHKRDVENVEQFSASLRKEELAVDKDGNTIIVDGTKVNQ